jgi:FAS-associated factor 2
MTIVDSALQYIQNFFVCPQVPHSFDFPQTEREPPNFFQGAFAQAVTTARNSSKFLLVILHSSRNPESVRFCKEVLCEPRVKIFLDENFILWGGDMKSEESFRMSQVLAATTFPFVSLMCYFNNSNMTKQLLSSMRYNFTKFTRSGANVVHKFQGFIPGNEFLELLTYATEENNPLLIAIRMEKEGISTARNELNDQDLAFQESLRIDREKEEQKKLEEQKDREAADRIIKERQEAELRAEEERRKLIELEQNEIRKKEEREQKKGILISKLPLEPEKGENVISLMIRLDNGKKVARRFYIDDPIKYLFMFVETQIDIDEYELGISFPKQLIKENNQSFRDAAIPSNALIYVDKL